VAQNDLGGGDLKSRRRHEILNLRKDDAKGGGCDDVIGVSRPPNHDLAHELLAEEWVRLPDGHSQGAADVEAGICLKGPGGRPDDQREFKAQRFDIFGLGRGLSRIEQ
jgi:hypothetical protein